MYNISDQLLVPPKTTTVILKQLLFSIFYSSTFALKIRVSGTGARNNRGYFRSERIAHGGLLRGGHRNRFSSVICRNRTRLGCL